MMMMYAINDVKCKLYFIYYFYLSDMMLSQMEMYWLLPLWSWVHMKAKENLLKAIGIRTTSLG